MSFKPSASIIVATYNRSRVLYYCILSVLKSNFSDFEIIVVGDNCTDDTEATVLGFADNRIRFVNLPVNSGGQSTPNNVGVDLARGDYILFLNHDDLYFHDHVAKSMAFMERERAEVGWSPVLRLEKSGLEAGPPDPEHDTILIDGASADGRFDPRNFIIASSWVVRRNICRSVGPWRTAETTRLSPSQEWLFRAYRQGRRLVFHRYVSVLCIHAGVRRHSYVIWRSPDHERAWSWVAAGSHARCALLECAALEQAGRMQVQQDELRRLGTQGLLPSLRRKIVNGLRRIGMHPVAVERFFAGQPKGDWISQIRRFTGEAPEAIQGETIFLGSSTAEPFLGRGWHPPEKTGRWTSSTWAEILFSITANDVEESVFELSGHPLIVPKKVIFELNGLPVLTKIFDQLDTTVRMPVRGRGVFWLTITVETLASPSTLTTSSSDTRSLGFWMSWFRLVRSGQLSGNSGEEEFVHGT